MAHLPDSEFSGIRALTTQWLYSDWSKDKYETFTKLYSIRPIRDYFDWILDQRTDAEYMNANDLEWSDIHDPRKLRQTSSASRVYGNAYNFVSSNVKHLYD